MIHADPVARKRNEHDRRAVADSCARCRGGKSEFVSPSIADIRHYFCMRQSCNFHHRGDFMSPDTINAGCVRLCNGKLWKHSPLHGLCVSGAFCFVSISLENHICTRSSSSTVGGGGRTSWFCKAMIHNQKEDATVSIIARLHFLGLLSHCCASCLDFPPAASVPPKT